MPPPPPSPISRLAVIGAGQMGLGIAYVASVTARCSVTVCDTSPKQLREGQAFFASLLSKDVAKERMTEEEAREATGRMTYLGSIEELGSGGSGSSSSGSSNSSTSSGSSSRFPQMVIEAATENLAVKQAIFQTLAKHMPLDTILATNTSSISVSKIAASAALERRQQQQQHQQQQQQGGSAVDEKEEQLGPMGGSPARCLGLHFMNPVPVLKLVEIIPALQTSPATLATAHAFARACGKTVVQSKDSPGFVANRLLMPYINEAVIALDEGVASKEDIDVTMTLGMSHPMGPLKLADFIGLDTCLSIMETMHRETGDSKYRPAVLLGRMVDAGWVGKKGGRGFYDYP